MPSTIVETPILTYFDIPARSRGEALRLFFAEAEIEYVDNVFPREEWPTKKKQLIESGLNPFGAVPVVQVGEIVLTSYIPTLRYFSKKLGKYAGSTDEEAYKVDLLSDLVIDWRFSFGKLKPDHPAQIPRFYSSFEAVLKEGPFALGEEFSYADVLLYQALSDEGALKDESFLVEYPKLRAFVKAFEARPKIAAYLEERKKKHECHTKKHFRLELFWCCQIGDYIPILRYLSKSVGKYGRSTDEEFCKVDQVSDVYIDWRFSWAKSSGDVQAAIPRFYATFESFLRDGPFVLGSEFSYADIAVYQRMRLMVKSSGEVHAAEIPRFYGTFENFLRNGPFVLGFAFSCADIAVYQALHDDRWRG
ncbi:UNVERIFIED_CONTAM: hypothetical protein HDU68_007095 [Siphonaria sp. JEL0065]|nr:hypothetical protein HDU68_007095 [Siphonaria sp. JEL0065]